jgi:hypothetical protein
VRDWANTKSDTSSYNSTVFSSFPNTDYNVLLVNEAFGRIIADPDIITRATLFDGMQWNGFQNLSFSITDDMNYGVRELDPVQCLDAYAQDFHHSAGNGYIITPDNNPSQNSSVAGILRAYYIGNALPTISPYRWVCSQFSASDQVVCSDHIPSFRANISDWQPFHHRVGYCLIGQGGGASLFSGTVEICRVQVNLSLALIVGLINLAKLIVMCIVIFRVKETPLLTIGDTIKSFLSDPDPAVASMCLLDKADALHFKSSKKASLEEQLPEKWLSTPKRFSSARKRWYTTVRISRWIVFSIL